MSLSATSTHFKYLLLPPGNKYKYLQGWGVHHFPWQPVPMLHYPFGEEICPNVQSKLSLAQLEAISTCHITCYLGGSSLQKEFMSFSSTDPIARKLLSLDKKCQPLLFYLHKKD